VGWFSDIFGGDSQTTTTTVEANNQVTVNPSTTVGVVVDTSKLADAVNQMTASNAAVITQVTDAISKSDAGTIAGLQKHFDDTVAAYQSSMDNNSKTNMLLAVATAAALFIHGGR